MQNQEELHTWLCHEIQLAKRYLPNVVCFLCQYGKRLFCLMLLMVWKSRRTKTSVSEEQTTIPWEDVWVAAWRHQCRIIFVSASWFDERIGCGLLTTINPSALKSQSLPVVKLIVRPCSLEALSSLCHSDRWPTFGSVLFVFLVAKHTAFLWKHRSEVMAAVLLGFELVQQLLSVRVALSFLCKFTTTYVGRSPVQLEHHHKFH